MVVTPVRAVGVLLCLLAVSGATSACSSPSPQPPPAPSSSTIQPSGPNDVDTDLPAPEPAPTWDEQARTDAVQVATAAMTSFTDHQADAETWWQRLRPRLSPQAGIDYAGTDPSEVPAHRVSGPAVLLDQASAYLARVEVPTDAGTYQVLLSRTGADAPWLVERLSPPAEEASG